MANTALLHENSKLMSCIFVRYVLILFSHPKEIKKQKRLPAVLALTASQTGWRKLKIIFHYSNLTITSDFLVIFITFL